MTTTATTTPSTDRPDSSVNPMDWLFGEIHGLFGNAFLDKFRSGHTVNGKDTGIENMKSVWAAKIRENRMHLGEIKRGIAGCGRLKFPPSWSEFFELCRPAINVDAAIYEAVEQLQKRKDGQDNWSHPAIYWAAVKFGYHEMTTLSHSQIKPRFSGLLATYLAQPDLPPVPVQLEALPMPGETKLSREKAAEMVKQLKGGVFKTAGSPIDHRRWAKTILEREKRGDTKVTLLQVQFAREALRAEPV